MLTVLKCAASARLNAPRQKALTPPPPSSVTVVPFIHGSRLEMAIRSGGNISTSNDSGNTRSLSTSRKDSSITFLASHSE